MARRARDEKTGGCRTSLPRMREVTDWPATEDQHRLETFYLTSSYNEVAERLQVTT